MRHILALLVLCLSSFALDAHAQAQRFAVISLIGDRMQLAYAKPLESQPGVDRIERRYIPLDDTTIDRAALLAANEQLKKLRPGSDPVLLQAFERSYFDVSAGTGALVEWIRQLVKDKKVTHAILITKLQYEGIPDLQKAFVGNRSLEGVGFFVGRTPAPTGMDPSGAGPGFLSPFAYFEVSLVELASGRVLRTEKGLASTAISATGTDSGNPWEALSAAQKSRALTDLVGNELAIVMPKVLATR